jgi:hypothetical protein
MAFYFDSDGFDLFLCVGDQRIAKRLNAKWVVIAAGWQVTGTLQQPVIVHPGKY